MVPQSGSVEIDGVPLDDTNRGAWHSAIAYVPQNVFLCDATLAENIALGTPTACIDRERLGAVVRQARLAEYVATLPLGYEEKLGERGARLSGGQRPENHRDVCSRHHVPRDGASVPQHLVIHVRCQYDHFTAPRFAYQRALGMHGGGAYEGP